MNEYIKKQNEKTKNEQTAALDNVTQENRISYDTAQQTSDTAFAEIMRQMFDDNKRRQADTNAVLQANGLNTSEGSQAALSQGNTLRANEYSIDVAQENARRDIDTSRQAMEESAKAAVQQAIANADYNSANQLYTNFKTERNIAQSQVNKLLSAGVMPDDDTITKSGYDLDYVKGLYQKAQQEASAAAAAKAAAQENAKSSAKEAANSVLGTITSALQKVSGNVNPQKGNTATLVLNNMQNLKSTEERQIYILSALQNGMIDEGQSGKLLLLGTQAGAWNKPKITALELGAIDGDEPVDATSTQKIVRAMYGNAPVAIPKTVGEAKTLIANYILNTSFSANYDAYKTMRNEQLEYYAANGTPEEKTLAQLELGVINEDDLIARLVASQQYITDHKIINNGETSYTVSRLFYNGYTEDEVTQYLATRSTEQAEADKEAYQEMLNSVDYEAYADTRAASMGFLEVLFKRAGATLWNLGSGILDILSTPTASDPDAVLAEYLEPTADKLEKQADRMYRSANIGLESIKDGKSDVGKFLIDASVVASDVAFDAMLNYLVPYGGLASMGIRSYEQGEMAGRSMGLDEGAQQLYGLSTAAIEMLTEKMFSGLKIAYGSGFVQKTASKLTSRLSETEAGRFISNLSSTAIGKLVTAGLGEGIEEVAADFGQAGIDYAFGLTDSYEINMEDVLYDGLLGCFIGLLGGGANVAVEKAATVSSIRDAIWEKQLNRLSNTQMNFQQSQEINNLRHRRSEQSDKNAAWQATIRDGTTAETNTNYTVAQTIIARSKQGAKAALTQALTELQNTGKVSTTEASVTAAVDAAVSNGSSVDVDAAQQKAAAAYDRLVELEEMRSALHTAVYQQEKERLTAEWLTANKELQTAQKNSQQKTIDSTQADAEYGQPPVLIESSDTASVAQQQGNDGGDGLGAADAGFTRQSPEIESWYADAEERGSDGFHTVSDTQAQRYTERTGFAPNEVPKYDAYDQHLSRVVSNAMNSSVTPEALHNSLLENARTGKFSYLEITDDEAKETATKQINADGWEASLTNFKTEVQKGKTGKELVTKGMILYNNAVTAGNYIEAIGILSYIQQAATSAAQTVQAMQILSKLTPECQLYGAVKGIDNVIAKVTKRYGLDTDIEVDEKLLEDYYKTLKSGDEKQISQAWGKVEKNIAGKIPSDWRDKLSALRYLSMLGNPRTHIRNIIGNLSFMPVWAFADGLAAGMEIAVDKISGGKIERTKAFLNRANPNDKALLAVAHQDYDSALDKIMSNGKYKDATLDSIDKQRKTFKGFNIKGKHIENPVETLSNWNTKALEVEDSWFARPAYKLALAGYLKANGISAQEYVSGLGKDERMTKAQEYAIKEAQKKTYRDANAVSNFVSHIKVKAPSADASFGEKAVNAMGTVMVESTLPFKRTPANILVRATEYSPLGFAEMAGQMIYAAKHPSARLTGAEIIAKVSQGLSGTVLVGLGVWLAAEGVLRLRGNNGDDEKSLLDREQAYSLTIGDTNITLDWLAPEILPIMVGVELRNEWAEKDGDASVWDYFESLFNLAEPITEMSMLQGVQDMVDSLGNSDNIISGVLVQSAAGYLSQFLPTLGGQIERSIEDKRQTTFIDRNSDVPTDIQYILGKAFNKNPFAEYQQIDYYDAWGRTQETGNVFERIANNFLNPAYVNKVLVEDVEAELERLDKLGESGMYPSKPSQSIQIEGEYLTAEQYEQLTKEAGQLKLETVGDVQNNKAYKKLKDVDKAEVIRDAYSYATAIAKSNISDDYEMPSWVEKAEEFGDVSTYIIARQGISNLDDRKKDTVCPYINSLSISAAQKSKLYELMFPNYKNDYRWR